MKKLLFLALLLICSMSTIQAQFSLGLDVGLNYNHAKFSGINDFDTNVFDTKAHLAYYLGLRPTYALSSKVNIGLGLQYSVKGYESQSGLYAPKVRNYYLDMLPQVEFRPINLFSLVGGVNIGYLAETSAKIDEKWDKNYFLFDAYKKVDFGLLLGLKMYLKQFYVTAHYNHGVVDINEITFTDANGEDIGTSNQFNRNLQIGIGYMLDL